MLRDREARQIKQCMAARIPNGAFRMSRNLHDLWLTRHQRYLHETPEQKSQLGVGAMSFHTVLIHTWGDFTTAE